MGTMMKSGTDVVSFLKEQHQQVKQLFQNVTSARGEQKKQAFLELRRMLAVHETAEEEIVHPVAKRVLPNGESIVETRLQEENEAKKVLGELEHLADVNIDSIAFETTFAAFEKSVIAHAEAEETEEFSKLGAQLDQSRLERMGKVVKIAEAIAPTRPHAGVESAIANAIVGPFASMMDRTRDVLTGKSGGTDVKAPSKDVTPPSSRH